VSDNDHTDGGPARWRCNYTRNAYRHAFQWVLESDAYHGIALIELPWVSQWHKDRNPNWAQEQGAEIRRCQAAADLIQAAPFMLNALLLAKSGDTSLIDAAIDRATGKLDWFGEDMLTTMSQSRYTNEDGDA